MEEITTIPSKDTITLPSLKRGKNGEIISLEEGDRFEIKSATPVTAVCPFSREEYETDGRGEFTIERAGDSIRWAHTTVYITVDMARPEIDGEEKMTHVEFRVGLPGEKGSLVTELVPFGKEEETIREMINQYNKEFNRNDEMKVLDPKSGSFLRVLGYRSVTEK